MHRFRSARAFATTTPWAGSCTDMQQLVDLTTTNIPFCTGMPSDDNCSDYYYFNTVSNKTIFCGLKDWKGNLECRAKFHLEDCARLAQNVRLVKGPQLPNLDAFPRDANRVCFAGSNKLQGSIAARVFG